MSDATPDLSEFVRQWGTEALEHPDCGLCGGDDRRQLVEEHFAEYVFGVVECTSCGFAYTCPRLTSTLREQLHTPRLRNALVDAGILARHHRVPTEHPAVFDYDAQEVHLQRYRIGLSLLRQWAPSGRLLDVGCAGGRFVELAGEAGYEAMGCDVVASALEHGRGLGLDLRLGTVGDLGIPAASLDAVTLWNVLEHVPEPRATMSEVVSLLRPGGVVLIESPSFAVYRIRARLGLVAPPGEHRLDAYEHINHFTPATLRRLLHGVGCEDVEFSIATGGGSRSLKERMRSSVTRLIFALTCRGVNLHFPLLAVARKAR
ncbi:MAG: class I SAM-dependent methyltransferase [Armatimonadota bacterium]|jgi:2-polyprenyl-3-methyl-5-hydroxy-6-metoxy-1,4-benzoquinol methylase